MQLLQDGNLNAKWLSQFGTSQLYSLLQKQTPVICKSWPICWRVTAVRRQVASHHNLSNSLVFECSPRQGCQLQLLTSVIVSKNIESNHWATTRILNICFPQSQKEFTVLFSLQCDRAISCVCSFLWDVGYSNTKTKVLSRPGQQPSTSNESFQPLLSNNERKRSQTHGRRRFHLRAEGIDLRNLWPKIK